jgi:AAA domain
VKEKICLIVDRHLGILGHLIIVDKDSNNWDATIGDVRRGLDSIRKELRNVLTLEAFNSTKVAEFQATVRNCEETLYTTMGRVRKDLIVARVRMATIGSSHKLYPEEQFENVITHSQSSSLRDVIVIVDEAGCIPAYELLGLGFLRRNIKSIVCVGDVNQLPPYVPQPICNDKKTGKRGKIHCNKFFSILDVSALHKSNDAKVFLRKQYRVPADIASILKVRVYKGKYETAKSAKVPKQGFHFVDVTKSNNKAPRFGTSNKKYVNKDEIEKCISILQDIKSMSTTQSVMILTTVSDKTKNICDYFFYCIQHSVTSYLTYFCQYKNQQHELEVQLRKNGHTHQPVRTIDQCQGQEADHVIWSLAQKPTRFLDKKRFNVAISRVRKKLYLVADKKEFQAACDNTNWESCWIAKDLLRLP